MVQEHLKERIVRVRVALGADQGPIQTNVELFDQVMRQVVGHIRVIPRGQVRGGIGSFFEIQFNGEIASIQIHKIRHGLNDKFHRHETICGGGDGDHTVPHVPHICFRHPKQAPQTGTRSLRPSVCGLWFLLYYTRHGRGMGFTNGMGLCQARAFL